MAHGELKRHSQPTDIVVRESSNHLPLVVLGVVGIVCVTVVVAMALAVVVVIAGVVLVVAVSGLGKKN